MRIVFFGTPEFAVASLERLLHERYDVAAVVTQPDKPQGRSRSTLVAPPVKLAAAAGGTARPSARAADGRRLPRQPPAPRRRPRRRRRLWAHSPARAADAPAARNDQRPRVAAAAIPRARRRSSTRSSRGDTDTGVSIMRMEEGLDSGPVLLQARDPDHARVRPPASSPVRLADLGATALVAALSACWRMVRLRRSRRTRLGRHLRAEGRPRDARLDWTGQRCSARAAGPRIRSRSRRLDHAPGSAAQALRRDGAATARASPARVLSAGEHLVVAAGVGALAVREVQPAGKTRLTVADWVRGRGISRGAAWRETAAATACHHRCRRAGRPRPRHPRRRDRGGRLGRRAARARPHRRRRRARRRPRSGLLALARPPEAAVFVNGRPDLAAAVAADGVQLSSADLAPPMRGESSLAAGSAGRCTARRRPRRPSPREPTSCSSAASTRAPRIPGNPAAGLELVPARRGARQAGDRDRRNGSGPRRRGCRPREPTASRRSPRSGRPPIPPRRLSRCWSHGWPAA